MFENLTLPYHEPLERGDILRRALRAANSGDRFYLGDSLFDLGKGPGIHVGLDCRLLGDGAMLLGQWNYQLQNFIELSQGVIVDGINSNCNADDITQCGMAIGFSQAQWSKDNWGFRPQEFAEADVRNGTFEGNEYGGYIWSVRGCRINSQSVRYRGKIGFCLGTGSGKDGCFGFFDRTTCEGDSRLNTTGGASGTASIGLLIRGGEAHLRRSLVSAYAEPAADPKKNANMVVGIYLGMADETSAVNNIGGPTWAAGEAFDTDVHTKAVGLNVPTFDLVERIGQWPKRTDKTGRLLVVNGRGSNIGGSFTQSGVVQVLKSPAFPAN